MGWPRSCPRDLGVEMFLVKEGHLLRIFVGESDKHQGRPLYEWIVRQAREQGLAGATVLRGMMGFGANTRVIHTFKIERLSEDLPVVIEIVDTQEKIEAFFALIESQIEAGLATLERVNVRVYRSTGGGEEEKTK